jgi:hypothetical protein
MYTHVYVYTYAKFLFVCRGCLQLPSPPESEANIGSDLSGEGMALLHFWCPSPERMFSLPFSIYKHIYMFFVQRVSIGCKVRHSFPKRECIYIYVYIYIHKDTCMPICVYIYVYMHMHTHKCERGDVERDEGI